jgi:hypothetical protein
VVLPTTLALTPIAPADRVTADEASGRSTVLSDQSVASAPKDRDGGLRLCRRHPLLLIWAVSTCLLFCLYAAWSFVQPIGATNDESAQLIKAASVVRGEFVGPAYSPKLATRLTATNRVDLEYCNLASGAERCDKALTVVTVPDSFANYIPDNCDLLPVYPVGCGHGLRGSGRPTIATTYVGRYPPLYYATVGLPSLLWHTDTAVYLMRLVSGLISAIFLGLALALASVWSRSRLLPATVAVAATPMVFIFGSVVNPSGLEAAAAICVWTGGLIIVLDWVENPPTSLIAATAIAAIVLVLCRGLSPLWLAVIGVTLAALAPRSLSILIRSHSVRLAMGVVTVVSAIAVVYILWAHTLSVYPIGTPFPAGTSVIGVLELVLGRTDLFVQEFVGEFATQPVIFIWIVSVSTVVVLAIVTGLARHSAVIITLVVASLVLPTALMMSQAYTDGVVWQARDGFPLYVGVILVAGAVMGRNVMPTTGDEDVTSALTRAPQRLITILAISVAALQLADFLWALRRYTVGLGSTVNPFAHVRDGWNPPGSSVGLVVVTTVTCIAYLFWIVRLSRPHNCASVLRAAHEDRPSSVQLEDLSHAP